VKPSAHSHYTFQPFSCGIPEFDRYLPEQASQDARRKVARAVCDDRFLSYRWKISMKTIEKAFA